jgi:hypothetical protein
MIKNKTARNKFQGGELATVKTQSVLFVTPQARLYRQLPSRGVFCFEGVATLRTRPPGCRVDIKEIAARWQELSFNQHSLCFAYLP